jgi:pyruvate kinase
MLASECVIATEPLASKERRRSPHPPVDLRRPLLRDHARLLLGPTRRFRSVRIMVTMPSEAATNEQLLVDLLRAGMDVMRINCAHDDAHTWRAGREPEEGRAHGRAGCRIQADLAGPKLRTGAIAPVGHFVRIKPVGMSWVA